MSESTNHETREWCCSVCKTETDADRIKYLPEMRGVPAAYCLSCESIQPVDPAPSHTERGGGTDPMAGADLHHAVGATLESLSEGRQEPPGVTENVGDDRTGETDENRTEFAKAEFAIDSLVWPGGMVGPMKARPVTEAGQEIELAPDTEAVPAVFYRLLFDYAFPAVPVVSDREAGTDDDRVEAVAKAIHEANHFDSHGWDDPEFVRSTARMHYRDMARAALAAAVPGDGQITVNREHLDAVVNPARHTDQCEKSNRGLWIACCCGASDRHAMVKGRALDHLRAALDGDKEGPA